MEGEGVIDVKLCSGGDQREPTWRFLSVGRKVNLEIGRQAGNP